MRYLIVFILTILFAIPTTAVTDDRGLGVVEKTRDSRKRVALVIGNSSYQSSPLKNPVNDAHAMASTLSRLGFEVDERTNLGFIAFNEAVESFGNKLKTGGIGLFYYAGHGMQVGGANYLIPVDSAINTENEVRYKAIDAGLVFAKMESAKGDVNIAILDACRDNPFARSFRSASRGLAQVDAPTGTIIAYATAPGKTANDGEGKNGAYTESLIRAMESPGLKVEEVFKRVRKMVLEKTANAQVPWESSSLTGDFHFIQPSQMTNFATLPAQIPTIESTMKQPPTITFAKGGSYVGSVVNGKPNGFGKLTYSDGTTYEGDHVDGSQTGRATVTFAKGGSYVGSVVNGKPNGFGKWTYSDGTTYEGDHVDGLQTGKGEYNYNVKTKYEQMMRDPKLTQAQKETMTKLKDGVLSSYYRGDVVNGKPHGYGTMRFPNGNVLTGNFINGIYSK